MACSRVNFTDLTDQFYIKSKTVFFARTSGVNFIAVGPTILELQQDALLRLNVEQLRL